jgi:hypothetical protein
MSISLLVLVLVLAPVLVIAPVLVPSSAGSSVCAAGRGTRTAGA